VTAPAREALVLRVVDFGESDRIVHLLTPDAGRLAAIAKGARRSVRRFPGTLDVFHQLRVQVAERRRPGSLARLEQARLVGWFPGLRSDATRFALGCFVLELLDRLAPENAHPQDARRLFRFALEALALVERAPADARLRVLLELVALDALGLRPELEACVRCGGGPPAGFLVAEGGVVCGTCAQRVTGGLLPVRPGTLRALVGALRLPLARLDRLVLTGPPLAEARELVARLARFHIGLELRSDRFLDEILDRPAVGAA
jgi:DNA repair protein RecO (recombination protein O)